MDFDIIVGKVMAGVYDNVTTTDLDELAAQTCAYMTIVHPDYSILAARIAVSNLHKQTKDSFVEVISDLRNYVDGNGRQAPLISEEVYEIVIANKEVLEKAIDYKRDLNYDYFGFKTLEKSYLLKLHNKIAERP